MHGVIRRSSSFNTERIDHLYRDPHDSEARLFLHYGDLADGSAISNLLAKVKPERSTTWARRATCASASTSPSTRHTSTGLGTVRLLEAIRDVGLATRFYQASSSELHGKVVETPQRETTPPIGRPVQELRSSERASPFPVHPPRAHALPPAELPYTAVHRSLCTVRYATCSGVRSAGRRRTGTSTSRCRPRDPG